MTTIIDTYDDDREARILGSLTDDARENFLKVALEVAIRM